ncbi:MAG: FAD-dependent oxidoreductase [Treponema sp.]|nr:FAD-dependent oxidoreductase [Treponema sp.]
MKKYDTIIIGSGPAGLGAAWHLTQYGNAGKILIIEQHAISSGGLRNDCKLNFTFPIGFPAHCWDPMDNAVLAEVNSKLLELTHAWNKHFGIPLPAGIENAVVTKYEARAQRLGVQFIPGQQVHLGTDGGISLINALLKYLKKHNVTIINKFRIEAASIDIKKKTISAPEENLQYKNLILAPGRAGHTFVQEFMHLNGIKYHDNCIDAGIRLETNIEHYSIVNEYYDPKFYFPERVRTFCTNAGAAYVIQEKYGNWYSVNGHAYSKKHKQNNLANFAILKTLDFTEPIASGHDYAESIAATAMLAGGGKPIMQRIGDFRMGKRSTPGGFVNDDLYQTKPTLKACPGDISLVIPAKILRAIWNALKQLDTIVPGVLHPGTIMYWPEIKMYNHTPRFANDSFMLADGVYGVGDGFGTSRGITAAWLSGQKAASHIVSG